MPIKAHSQILVKKNQTSNKTTNYIRNPFTFCYDKVVRLVTDKNPIDEITRLYEST